jgi:hypothetical protein
MAELRAMGVRYLAPPIPVLIGVEDGAIVPTAYARAARAAGLELITWTLERPGTLAGDHYVPRQLRGALTRARPANAPPPTRSAFRASKA